MNDMQAMHDYMTEFGLAPMREHLPNPTKRQVLVGSAVAVAGMIGYGVLAIRFREPKTN